jgi:phage recombination protein Bet
MNDIALSERQLATLKNTIAKPLNAPEFNLFTEYCRNIGLDPIRKQVIPIIFSADDAAKRQMTIVVTIDGLRTIAERVQNYRPDEEEPRYFYSEEMIDPYTNPKGIERCIVYAWKQDKGGTWNRVAGAAYWDEFAPIKEDAEGGYDWIDTGEKWPDSGKPKKKKVPRGEIYRALDPKTLWPKMPRIMIAKCAEAQALRKGWPDQFSGVHVDAEFDKAVTIDADASEVVERYAERERMKMIGGEKAVTFLLDTAIGLERLPVGKIADRFLDAARRTRDLNEFASLTATNRDSLREFWSFAPGDSLALKKELEAIEGQLRAKEPTQRTVAA